jgi:hypothetical protein
VKRYGKYGGKPSWNVKRYGKYEKNVSWIVKRYEKYGKKQIELWKDMENMEEK